MFNGSRRQWRSPNPYKRAIAVAIDLERMHDALAGVIGHSIPIPDRITDGPRVGRRVPMNLPRALTLDHLNGIAADRMDAISDMHTHLAPTMSASEAGLIDEFVEDLRERTASEQNHRVAKRGPSRQIDPDDRLSAEEKMRRDIERAADAPPPPIALADMRRRSQDEDVDRQSISIDLMFEGLIDHHRINRDALYAEVMQHQAKLTKIRSSRVLMSPSMGSNSSPTLKSLGKAFPRTTFLLRGLSLDISRLEMPIDPRGDPYRVWTYTGGHWAGDTHFPTLTRQDGMPGHDVFDFPRRALRDIIDDPRFHDAMVIHTTDRYGMTVGSGASTVMKLRRGYAHLDPPGTNPGLRVPIRRPSDVRPPRQARAEEHRDLDWSQLIDRLLSERGHSQRRTIRIKEGSGLMLSIADPGPDERLAHSYEIVRDTLDDGEDAIRARIDDIVSKMNGARRRDGFGRSHHRPIATVPAATSKTPDVAPGQRMHDALGEEEAQRYETATRIDALLADLVTMEDGFDPENLPELHVQEGVLTVREMRIAPDMVYRVEKFDRLLGKVTHAVGTVEVARELGASTIEALRDGSVRRLIDRFPQFSGAQVRKVSRCDGATLVTVRLPLVTKP